jgi:hypothetical protein
LPHGHHRLQEHLHEEGRAMSRAKAFKDIFNRVLNQKPITPIEKEWLVGMLKEQPPPPPHIVAIGRKIERNEL